MLAVAVSATFPAKSETRAFPKPFDLASVSILALFGYKQPALALTTLSASTGLLKRVVVSVVELSAGAIGISSKQTEKAVEFSRGTIASSPPSTAQDVIWPIFFHPLFLRILGFFWQLPTFRNGGKKPVRVDALAVLVLSL